jgi:hypothetical protein
MSMISRHLALPRVAVWLIALGSLIDGMFAAIYVAEGKFEVRGQFSWGWVVAGLLMTCVFLSLARDFERKTEQYILGLGSLLTLVETLNYVAAHLAMPIANVSLYAMNVACDVLIVCACVVHIIRRRQAEASLC